MRSSPSLSSNSWWLTALLCLLSPIVGVKLDQDQAQKNPKKQHETHRQHAKVTAGAHRTVLRTGRVLGPKLDSKQKVKKAGNGGAKQQAARQPKTVAKMPQKRAETGSSISLEDKLGLPLDALVSGKNNKRSSGNMKRR